MYIGVFRTFKVEAYLRLSDLKTRWNHSELCYTFKVLKIDDNSNARPEAFLKVGRFCSSQY